MKVSLPPALKQFVDDKVKEGLYQNESELICESLRRLKERDNIRGQTATLEVAVQQVMNEINRLRSREDELQNRVKETQEAAQAITESLLKALEALNEASRSLQGWL